MDDDIPMLSEKIKYLLEESYFFLLTYIKPTIEKLETTASILYPEDTQLLFQMEYSKRNFSIVTEEYRKIVFKILGGNTDLTKHISSPSYAFMMCWTRYETACKLLRDLDKEQTNKYKTKYRNQFQQISEKLKIEERKVWENDAIQWELTLRDEGWYFT